jgi:hypothetical protein
VRITMVGEAALRWRQMALRTDEAEIKKQYSDELQQQVPPGVQVRLDHFLGLTDTSSVLMAVVDVSGNMGTQTGKRLFLPGSFFEASGKTMFSAEKRESPVDLHYPYIEKDLVNLKLPAGLTVQSVPSDAQVPFPKNAAYQVKYSSADNTLHEERVEALANPLYLPAEYPQLLGFFQKVDAQDQQQMVLARSVVTAAQ